MGWQGHRWFVCASLLGFVVSSAHGVTVGELFPFGPSAGDQVLEAGSDQTYRLELDKPALFYDGTFDSIFVSERSNLRSRSFGHVWSPISFVVGQRFCAFAHILPGSLYTGIQSRDHILTKTVIGNGERIYLEYRSRSSLLPPWGEKFEILICLAHSLLGWRVHAFLQFPPWLSFYCCLNERKTAGTRCCNPSLMC